MSAGKAKCCARIANYAIRSSARKLRSLRTHRSGGGGKVRSSMAAAGKTCATRCNQCHWRGRGLSPECTTCHARPAGAPMAALPCASLPSEGADVKPLTPCISCHPNRAELHLKATHAATDCTVCHTPHQWTVPKEKLRHLVIRTSRIIMPQGLCRDCHPFRQAAKAS